MQSRREQGRKAFGQFLSDHDICIVAVDVSQTLFVRQLRAFSVEEAEKVSKWVAPDAIELCKDLAERKILLAIVTQSKSQPEALAAVLKSFGITPWHIVASPERSRVAHLRDLEDKFTAETRQYLRRDQILLVDDDNQWNCPLATALGFRAFHVSEERGIHWATLKECPALKCDATKA